MAKDENDVTQDKCSYPSHIGNVKRITGSSVVLRVKALVTRGQRHGIDSLNPPVSASGIGWAGFPLSSYGYLWVVLG